VGVVQQAIVQRDLRPELQAAIPGITTSQIQWVVRGHRAMF
jgi:hypothetical protein